MRKLKSRILIGFLSLLITTLMGWEGRAQSQEAYPTRPIEIIVTTAPGGSYDLTNRSMAIFLSKKWGVPVNVVNKPGGNGIPGLLAFYNAKPDGYTMLGDGNSYSSLLVTIKDLPFRIMDRTFVCRVGTAPMIPMVAANSPFKSLRDVAAEAKRDPGNFTWAMHGAGTDSTGFCFRQFFKEIDVDPQKTKAISVPGGGPGVILVAGGNAIMNCPGVGTSVAPLKAGTLRALAVTSKNRHPDLPDVPTTAEAGFPNMDHIQWNGISGPPKLPASIIAKWEKTIEDLSREPEVLAKMKDIGLTPGYLDSKTIREFVIKEVDDASKLWGVLR